MINNTMMTNEKEVNKKEKNIIYYCEQLECGKYFKTEKDRQVLLTF